jgi:hypothetical protein
MVLVYVGEGGKMKLKITSQEILRSDELAQDDTKEIALAKFL